VIGVIIGVLHQAFTIGSQTFPHHRRSSMKGIVQGILGGHMLWPYVIAGAVLAFVLILINLPVLPVAIGIYLPFTLSVPIFIGGGIRYLTDSVLKKKYGMSMIYNLKELKEKGIALYPNSYRVSHSLSEILCQYEAYQEADLQAVQEKFSLGGAPDAAE
jgi:uncharacterized oligopeptide transporter (OPT) family protein